MRGDIRVNSWWRLRNAVVPFLSDIELFFEELLSLGLLELGTKVVFPDQFFPVFAVFAALNILMLILVILILFSDQLLGLFVN